MGRAVFAPKISKTQMVFANGTRNVYRMWDPCTQKPPGSVPDVGTASPSFSPALPHFNGPSRCGAGPRVVRRQYLVCWLGIPTRIAVWCGGVFACPPLVSTPTD